MHQEIPIKITPYLGRSKELIEFFGIIGYNEDLLFECSPDYFRK